MERLYEPPLNHNGSASPPSTSQTRMQRMLEEMEAWKDATIEAIKTRHADTHREQLSLLQPLEGLNMEKILTAMIKLNAIEEVKASIDLTRNAIKIARSTVKVDDASRAVLERCVKLALSLQEQEE